MAASSCTARDDRRRTCRMQRGAHRLDELETRERAPLAHPAHPRDRQGAHGCGAVRADRWVETASQPAQPRGDGVEGAAWRVRRACVRVCVGAADALGQRVDGRAGVAMQLGPEPPTRRARLAALDLTLAERVQRRLRCRRINSRADATRSARARPAHSRGARIDEVDDQEGVVEGRVEMGGRPAPPPW